MANSGNILTKFYAAVAKRDLKTARKYLRDDLVFKGLFETYPDADSYLAALTKLLSITVRLDVRAIVAQGDDAAVFFDLETKTPVEATTFVAEWHRMKEGKIHRVQSAFDGRAFARMFGTHLPGGAP